MNFVSNYNRETAKYYFDKIQNNTITLVYGYEKNDINKVAQAHENEKKIIDTLKGATNREIEKVFMMILMSEYNELLNRNMVSLPSMNSSIMKEYKRIIVEMGYNHHNLKKIT